MSTDDFEKKLRRQPLKRIPGDWRELILQTAHDRTSCVAAKRSKSVLIRAVQIAWRELIQPCRHAWSGMAALWLIFGLINAHTEVTETPRQMASSSRSGFEGIQVFEEQRRVLVELTGPNDLSPAEPSRPAHAKPRSERTLRIRNC